MVYRLLRHFDFGSSRVRPCDIRAAPRSRRACYCRVVLVHRILHGNVHWQFRGRASISLPYGGRDVFCYQTCRSRGSGCYLLMDPRLVQPAWANGGRVQRRVHGQPNDLSMREHEFDFQRREIFIFTVSLLKFQVRVRVV